ncbi:MAG: shikimate kinase [Clostridia bacterium]|nr:shikimate kinase [Clostridia bacterium]
MNNIVLIGMPGSGKSTCGVLAAKAMCMDFTDTDLLIQSAEKCTLQQTINEKGNGYFAAAEEAALLACNYDNTLIATGGSAVYSEKGILHLKEKGTVVYLKVSLDEMTSRIKNIRTRGIVLKEGETLEDMFHRREKLYEKYADYIIDCTGSTVEQTVEKICSIKTEQKA